MTAAREMEASDLIWKHWQNGTVIADLPPGLKPASRGEGYAIQACMTRFSARPIAGWKIAATSVAGQTHIGVDGPLAGRLLQEFVHGNGAALSLATNRMLSLIHI